MVTGNTDSLILSLNDAIKDISPKGTTQYSRKLYDTESNETAIQIIESGFYWEVVKAKLIEIGRFNEIQDLPNDWITEINE